MVDTKAAREADQWSPGVRAAMEKFCAGLDRRRASELGVPWHVEPWGDGSKPPFVNICSHTLGLVVAADLERETANFIVGLVNTIFAAPPLDNAPETAQ